MPSALRALLQSTPLYGGYDRLVAGATTSGGAPSPEGGGPACACPGRGLPQPQPSAAAPATAATRHSPASLRHPAPQPRPFLAAAPAEAGAGWQAVVAGPALQCFEAATLGMPLEVWKTYLGRNRGVSTLGAVREIYAAGGMPAFWAGTSAKMFESASKGLVLMWAKESLLNSFGGSFSPGERKKWSARCFFLLF